MPKKNSVKDFNISKKKLFETLKICQRLNKQLFVSGSQGGPETRAEEEQEAKAAGPGRSPKGEEPAGVDR